MPTVIGAKMEALPMRLLALTSGFAVCARNARMCERSALIAHRGRSRRWAIAS